MIKSKENRDDVLFRINCNNILKNVMIERSNIKIDFLKKQGRQLYRIPPDVEFSFAYHPWRSSIAPEIGYIIKNDKTLNKIFHVVGSKLARDTATIILNIVFADQYHLYDPSNEPFSHMRRTSGHSRAGNQILNGIKDSYYQNSTIESTDKKHIQGLVSSN